MLLQWEAAVDGAEGVLSAPLFFKIFTVCVLETCFYCLPSPLCCGALWVDRRLCCSLPRCVVVTVRRHNGTDICSAFLQCVADKDTVASSYIKGNTNRTEMGLNIRFADMFCNKSSPWRLWLVSWYWLSQNKHLKILRNFIPVII